DPDTLVRKLGSEAFRELVKRATPLEAFLFDAVSEGLDTATLEGRARLSKLALPWLRQLPDGVFRQLMFRALAERTGLTVAELMHLEAPPPPASAPPQEPSSGGETGNRGPRQRSPTSPAPLGYSNLAQAAIALLLHQPDIAPRVELEPLTALEGEDIVLLRELLDLLQRRPDSNTAMLLGHWYGTPEGELLSRLAGEERLIPREGIEKQFTDTLATLVQRPQRSKLSARVDKLKATNYADMSEADKQQLRELLKEKQRLDEARKKS
ncbi:MAG TPA: DNA primase, partial [Halieaceae bacterium]|nr:DNA primase [Halieaceae bacterium]